MLTSIMPQAEHRMVYAGRTSILPEVLMAGWDRFPRAGRLPAHVHRTAFEICLIVSGSVDWWVGEELHEVRGGDIYITRPGERHGGVDAVMNPCELFWFLVAMPRGHALPGLSAKESGRLRRGLIDLSLRSFRASDETRRACRRLHAEHASPDDLARLAARGALHALLAGVLRDHRAALRQHQTISEPVRRAVAFLHDHLGDPFRLDAAAEAAGISVGRLHARFMEEIGQTPADWRLRQSIAQAKTLLRNSDRAVTDIAMDLRFSSSQYFATAFKRVTGLAPQAYRLAHLIEK